MIGRVYRGSKVTGLLRYLYGPGRHDESLHEDPHMVAAWAHHSPQDLAHLEPEVLAGDGVDAVRNFGPLRASLERVTALRPATVDDQVVWHCALRNADADRVLTDAEWGEVARDVMDRTGIAPRDDPGGCRWVAVRHDEESIHLVAVLARQDGRPTRLWHDHTRVREACIAAETRYSLTATAPADSTAAKHTSRPEVEKSTRQGRLLPARDWLRGEVQHAAAACREPAAFLDRLRVAGVVVRERRDPDGQLSGYAVGREGDRNGDGEQVYYGGGKLAAGLSLPRLSANWKAAGVPQDASALVTDTGDRTALWERATEAVARAAEEVRTARAEDPDAGGDAAAAAAEILGAASRLIEGEGGGPLTQAARDYDRASRETYRRIPRPTTGGSMLRAVTYAMARASRPGGHRPRRSEAVQVAVLVSQISRLSLAVSQLREAQGRAAQSQAARRSATQLLTSTRSWNAAATTVIGEDQRAAAAAAARQQAQLAAQAAAEQARQAAATAAPAAASLSAPPAQRRGSRSR